MRKLDIIETSLGRKEKTIVGNEIINILLKLEILFGYIHQKK
jgi:hypothetical protein